MIADVSFFWKVLRASASRLIAAVAAATCRHAIEVFSGFMTRSWQVGAKVIAIMGIVQGLTNCMSISTAGYAGQGCFAGELTFCRQVSGSANPDDWLSFCGIWALWILGCPEV